MRLSDLLETTVHTEDGRLLGRVQDVKLRQDGPMQDGFTAGFRLVALVVGKRRTAARLGLVDTNLKGPWLLRSLARALQRDRIDIAWDDVRSVSDDDIVVASDRRS